LGKIKNRIIGSGEEQLDQIMFNPRNWRIHPLSQQDALKGVLEEVGWVQQVIVNKRTGNLIDGHLRCQLAAREGATTIPVVYVDVSEEEEALVLATLDPIAAMAATDKQKLEEILSSIESENEQVNRLIDDIREREEMVDNLGVPKDAKPNPRNLPIDVIFTMENYTSQWTPMAYYSGLKWGIQSNSRVLSESYNPHYVVTFVDNKYTDYVHSEHLEVVKRFRPKYCTVRDIMNQSQCEDAGIEYYDLSQILVWAEELRQYAENVIVIPKYDCLSEIPDHFVLGYSVPTSHGGTPLSVELFKGRRVHLLGGSWKAQLAHMAALGDDVVSLDNNHCHRIAEFGQFYLPDGETKTISDIFDTVGYPNPATIALALSFGAIGAKVNELYGGNGKPAEEE